MTPLADAARALELVEGQGYSVNKAAQVLGVPQATLRDVLTGDHGWEERKNKPVFAKYRYEQKLRLQHAAIELQKQALAHAEKVLPKSSFLQAVTGFAVLVDKERLMAGEPTELIGIHEIHEYRGLDELAEKLGQALLIKRESPTGETDKP